MKPDRETAAFLRAREKATKVRTADLRLMLVSSVRYALGRRTYIVGETCRLVRAYWGRLDAATKEVLARDIREAGADLGDDCDRADWTALLANLEAGS